MDDWDKPGFPNLLDFSFSEYLSQILLICWVMSCCLSINTMRIIFSQHKVIFDYSSTISETLQNSFSDMNSEEINTNDSKQSQDAILADTNDLEQSQDAILAELKTTNQQLLLEKQELQEEIDKYKQIMCSNTDLTTQLNEIN